MEKNSKIFIAGSETFIGKALFSELIRQGHTNVIGQTAGLIDLTNQLSVNAFFLEFNPEYVFLAAGKSGGIFANQKYPADLMINNLLVTCNVIQTAFHHKVKKLLYLASSCSYPRDCPQPMKVEQLLTGSLEPTNEAYSVAKISGIKLCQAYKQQYGADFIAGIPANVFGPGDDFSEENSHVIAGILRRMHEAKKSNSDTFKVWGTGKPRREFIYLDDLADACIYLMNRYDGLEPVNIGSGQDVSIAELTQIIKDVTGYNGDISFDTSKPDGMPIKVLDTGTLKDLGWKPMWSFEDALRKTYSWFLEEK